MKRLLVVGCARSGTGYTAGLLKSLGLDIGHERVFGPKDGFEPGPYAVAGHDVSWLAAPHLSRLDAQWVILHQIRHPVLVARSALATGMFDSRRPQVHRTKFWLRDRFGQENDTSGPSYVSVAHRGCPAIASERTAIDRSFRYWYGWNTLIEASLAGRGAHIWHRVEDIDSGWIDVVFENLELEPPRPSLVAEALEQRSKTANHRGATPSFALDEISNPRLRTEVLSLAQSYGYLH